METLYWKITPKWVYSLHSIANLETLLISINYMFVHRSYSRTAQGTEFEIDSGTQK